MKIVDKISDDFLAGCRYTLHLNTDKKINRILEVADFSRVTNKKPTKAKNIIFVTPVMMIHSGGLTSVLRIAKRLSENEFNVVFSCPTSDDCEQMTRNANINLTDFNARYITWENALKNEYDFVIATEDIMVYYARKLKGYLIYFVQDYEPYFNPIGDRYFISKKSYELGEDIISLGNWNINEIKKNCKDNSILGNLYSVEFPFEAKEYPLIERYFDNYINKKDINIAVYVKREPKRLPGIIMSMIEHASAELRKTGINLNVYYFGLHKVEKPAVGKNLGRISKNEIQELYKKCDFGLVASMTNISLVPYEMIGSGLPVIEFQDGSYDSFLDSNTAILLKTFDYRELAQDINYYINNPLELEQIVVRGRKKISNLSWDKTGKQFAEILKNIVE